MAHISQIAIDIGLPCFPCHADKRPETPHGLKDATSEPDGIRELWRRSPGPLIGVPTGDVSGLMFSTSIHETEAALGMWHIKRSCPWLPEKGLAMIHSTAASAKPRSR